MSSNRTEKEMKESLIPWAPSSSRLEVAELNEKLIELHRIMERKTGIKGGRISMQTYGIIQTAITRAVCVSDDVISRMIKS